MSRISAPRPSKLILLPGTVSVSQKSISLTVLVDSSADDDFIDSDFVFRHNIPTLPLPEPKAVYTLDGSLLSQVTHCTVPLSLCLSSNHHEHISLFLIPSPNNPLVLGLTWLKLHSSPYRLVHFYHSQLEPLLSFTVLTFCYSRYHPYYTQATKAG